MADITPLVPFVQTRYRWTENWTTTSRLRPSSAVAALQPTIGTAKIECAYGEIDGGIYEPWRTWQNVFVRILLPPTAEELRGDATLTGTAVWCGVITEKVDRNQRAFDRGSGEEIRYVATGKETLVARDLTYLLDRAAIRGSYVLDDEDSVHPTPVKVDEIYPFNVKAERGMAPHNKAAPWGALAGNRSSSRYLNPKNGRYAHIFADDGQRWSLLDIIEYLLVWWGSDRVGVYLNGELADGGASYTGVEAALNKIERCVLPGKSVRETLNAIIPRSRGLAWMVDTAEPPQLVIRSVIGEDIEAEGMTIPGNGTTHIIDGDSTALGPIEIQEATDHEYDRIEVHGAPIVTVGSVGAGQLIPAWSSPMESDYKSADLDGRATDEMGRVWTTFKIDPDINKEIFGPSKGLPTVDQSGGAPHSSPMAPLVRTGQTWLRQLPLLKGTDYANYANPVVVDAKAPAGDFLSPMVWVKCDVGADGSNGYYLVDQPVDTGTEKLRPPGSSVRMLDNDLGFQIGMRPGHRLALNHWADADGPDLADQVFDYAEIVATIAIAGPNRIKAVLDLPRGEDRDEQRVLVIEVPEAEYWWMQDKTVLGWTNTGLTPSPIYASCGILRDDRPTLQRVAAAAKAWYGRPRRQIRLAYKDLIGQFLPGDLIERVTISNRDPI